MHEFRAIREFFTQDTGNDPLPLKAASRSKWFYTSQLNIYLRAGTLYKMRYRTDRQVIVVSNISLRTSRLKGRGYFKKFAKAIEKIADELDMDLVYECVLNYDLTVWLKQYGYEKTTNDDYIKTKL